MKKWGTGGLLLLLAWPLAACSGDSPPPKPVLPTAINIKGDLTLKGEGYVRGNLSECGGAGPYADLVVGAPVTVSSDEGRPLAIGKINYSVGTNVYRNRLDECVFRFTVFGVPRTRIYQIAIARQKPYVTSFLNLLAKRGTFNVNAWPVAVPTTTTTQPLSLSPIG